MVSPCIYTNALLDSLTRANLQMLILSPIKAFQLSEFVILTNSSIRLQIQLAQISVLPTLNLQVTFNGIQHTRG